MDPLFDCIYLKHALALGVGIILLLLTVLLVSRKIIGFTLSLIFLLIALGASLGIAHQDVVKTYINDIVPGTFTIEEQKE